MKKYFCDACETELPNWDETAMHKLSQAASMCGLSEVCPRCDALTDRLNIPGLVMSEWKRIAGSCPEDPTPPLAPTSRLRGQAIKEKRRILAAIDTYRKEQGPSSIPKLAQLAKINESDLRDIISCIPVPIATWRMVGEVLGVGKTVEGGGADP